MTRRFRSTRKFDKQFSLLDKNASKQAIKAIELYMEDPTLPSLRFKKIQGTGNFYEISVSGQYKCTNFRHKVHSF